MNFGDFKWVNESKAEYKDGVLTVYAPSQTDYFNSPVKENGAFPEPVANASLYYTELTGDFVFKTKVQLEFKNFYDEETLDLEEILVGKTMILQSEEAIDKILYQNILDNSACNKLYDRRLFDGLRFPIGKLYEDLAIFYKVYERAKKVVHRREAYYFYRLRRDSITGNFSLRRTDVLDITDEIVDYMKTCNLALLPAALDRKFAANMNILWLMTRSGQCDVAVEQRCWGNIKELRRMILCNPKSRLKNRLGALVAMLGLRGLKFIYKLKKHSR